MSARKDRDATRVAALRSALSAIDNAEAVDATQDVFASGSIAGAVTGLGAAEVTRRELSDAQIRELLRAEVDERTAVVAAIDITHTEHAARLRAEAAVLPDYSEMSDARARLGWCS